MIFFFYKSIYKYVNAAFYRFFCINFMDCSSRFLWLMFYIYICNFSFLLQHRIKLAGILIYLILFGPSYNVLVIMPPEKKDIDRFLAGKTVQKNYGSDSLTQRHFQNAKKNLLKGRNVNGVSHSFPLATWLDPVPLRGICTSRAPRRGRDADSLRLWQEHTRACTQRTHAGR